MSLRDGEYVEVCILPEGTCSCPGMAPASDPDPDHIDERMRVFGLGDTFAIGFVIEHACDKCNPGDGVICPDHIDPHENGGTCGAPNCREDHR